MRFAALLLTFALLACGGKKTPTSNGPTPSTMPEHAGVIDASDGHRRTPQAAPATDAAALLGDRRTISRLAVAT